MCSYRKYNIKHQISIEQTCMSCSSSKQVYSGCKYFVIETMDWGIAECVRCERSSDGVRATERFVIRVRPAAFGRLHARRPDIDRCASWASREPLPLHQQHRPPPHTLTPQQCPQSQREPPVLLCSLYNTASTYATVRYVQWLDVC